MANPYHHALSSVKKWGGTTTDYQAIHDWFDESKMMYANFRHRALRHHAEGIFMCEKFFGHTITNSDGRVIPVRWVGEQHVKEDCGFIPSIQDWFQHIQPQRWMGEPPVKLEKELDKMENADNASWSEHLDKKFGNSPERL
jgi:hypothetical protein